MFSQKISKTDIYGKLSLQKSGIITTDGDGILYSESIEDGIIKAIATISTFVTKDSNNCITSGITLSADQINFKGKTVINGKFTVDDDGTVRLTDMVASGKITSSEGNIGGFKINPENLTSTNGNNSLTLSYSHIYFVGSENVVQIGSDINVGSTGSTIRCSEWVTMARTPQYNEELGNIGCYISVTGANSLDGSDKQYTGNHALYIPYGNICGFRRRGRRLSGSETLSKMDSVIICNNTSSITIALPSDVEDMQEYDIITEGVDVYIKSASSCGMSYHGDSYSTNQSSQAGQYDLIKCVYDSANSIWHCRDFRQT